MTDSSLWIKKKVGADDTDPTLPTLNAKVVIKSAIIELLFLKLNDKLQNNLLNQLNKTTMLYKIDRCRLNAYILNSGVMHMHSSALSKGFLPNRVIMFLIDQRNFVGDYGLDPFAFKPHGLRRIQLLINGVESRKEYLLNEKASKNVNSDLINIFFNLHRFLGQDTHANAGIDFNQFSNSLCCFPFDLTPGLNGYDTRSTPLLKPGEISVRLEFNEPLSKNLVLLYYCEYKNTYELDVDRRIETNY